MPAMANLLSRVGSPSIESGSHRKWVTSKVGHIERPRSGRISRPLPYPLFIFAIIRTRLVYFKNIVISERKAHSMKMKNYRNGCLVLLVTLGLTLSFPAGASDLPDPGLTPGAINPNVSQDNIQSTICVKGFTKTIRPPAHFTNKLKKRQIRAYGYADRNPKHYEEDHLIALSIGGAPDDPRNLWPEPRISEWGADKKDQLEFVLYKMVCSQEIRLVDAQNAMATNWIEAWKQYVPSHQRYQFKHRVD